VKRLATARRILAQDPERQVSPEPVISSWGIAPDGFAEGARRPRALLFSHDTFGLGHLRRNLAIAEHLLMRRSNFEVMLLSGSPVADSWPMPAGLQLRLMPAVVKIGAEAYTSRNGSASFAEVKAQREAVILNTIRNFRPDVFLVDHSPAGMKGELLGALAFLRAKMPTTKTVLGLRDILDDGPTIRSVWLEDGIYDLIGGSYDEVLVYGSRSLFDVVSEYALPHEIIVKLRYCGHVARGQPQRVANDLPSRPARGKTVLVTVGGGGDGYLLIDAYLQALARLDPSPARSIVVSGPLMPENQQHMLHDAAGNRRDVLFTRSTTDMSSLLAEADLVVTMAGYNSTVEILAAQKPAILVPRAAPRAEQRLRARLLERIGVAWAVQPEDDVVDKLAGLLTSALAGVQPRALSSGLLDLGGARRVGDALEALLGLEPSSGSHR
jgi:predicted glycosyltransferase